jgi:cell wall integrity and stress response component
MQLIVAVTALAALGGALPDNIRSLRRWGASNIMGRQAGDPLAGKQEKAEMPKYKVATTNGCYKSPGELKVKMTKIEYNSESECGERICAKEGFLVGGSMGGMDCYCGNTYPPKEDLVEDDNCNMPCSGFGENACEFASLGALGGDRN